MNTEKLHQRFVAKRAYYCQRADRAWLFKRLYYQRQAARMARLEFLLTAPPMDIYIATKRIMENK